MTDHLSKEIRAGLDEARRHRPRKAPRMTVRTGGQAFTILRHWDRGFTLAVADAPGLRGLVDLYEGGRHVCQALVVTSREEAGERVFEFKFANRVTETAPSPDCVRGPDPAPLPPL